MFFKLGCGALLAFVFTIPWQALTLVAGADTISRLVGLAATPIAFVGILSRKKLRWHLFFSVSLLFVLMSALSLIWDAAFDTGYVYVLSLVQLWIMSWLVFQYSDDGPSIQHFFVAYVAGCVVASVALFVEMANGVVIAKFSGNTAGLFNPNDLAYTLAFGATFGWYTALDARSVLVRTLLLASAGFCVVAVVLTGSRGGFIILGLGMLFVVLALRRYTTFTKFVVVGVIGGAVWVVLTYTPLHIFERLSTIGAQISGGTMDHRTTIWAAGLAASATHPFIGTGAGSYMEVMQHDIGLYINAHSVYVKVLVETGIIGLVLFITELILAAWRAINVWSPVGRAFWVVCWLQLSLAMGTSNMAVWKLTWLVLALSVAAGRVAAPHDVAAATPAPRTDGRGLEEAVSIR